MKKHSKTLMIAISLLVFFIIAAISLSHPTVGWGRNIGTGNLFVFLSIFAASVACSAALWLVVMGKVTWNYKYILGYFVFALCSSAPLSDRAIALAAEKWGLAESVAQVQVMHFCIDNYNAAHCVQQLTNCPQCKRVLTLEQRRDLRTKLMAFSGQLDQVTLAQEAALQPSGGPLTDAAKQWREKNRAPAAKQ